MANKMLIDAAHPEETRVVVLRGQRVEEFDFESANRKQLRGNIYLAKVTRVEPSLQAAFVEYGGNRHGFLAFSEIHPDYYQIPVADRQALIAEDARAERDAERDEERARGRRRRRGPAPRRRDRDDTVSATPETQEEREAGHAFPPEAGEEGGSFHAHTDETSETSADRTESLGEHAEVSFPASEESQGGAPDEVHAAEGEETASVQPSSESVSAESAGSTDSPEDQRFRDTEQDQQQETVEAAPASAELHEGGFATNGDDASDEHGEPHEDDEDAVEHVGGADALEEVPDRRHRPPRRHYKIQEVIKRRQILLVQVVKEERGTKGAALTTYLSLAGRYSVLMPNTGRGGGISRKITSAEDRKRLREIAEELEVPEGMGVILRTAGAARTKAEIKRDFEYLMRLWESVRELTLSSSAPSLVYEEGSLIKRAIRDLYNKDIDEVLVAGDDAYREAKDFMRMLMPSHAKSVKLYKEPQPLFAKYGIEAQLDAMFSNQVQLKSGGYLVINPTEALVSIDVNSGRSTREHNIEDTALRTNLEAAEEIARQLRLRDLAGLIVIDFIDMEENRNNRAVEKKMKDCLKNDRARIQVGRISAFGLMEMSRQRIRTGVLESSSIPCAHCAGTGFVRATPSIALHILRSVEETLIRSASHNLTIRTRIEVAFYILNQKRAHLRDLEARFGVTVNVVADDALTGTTVFAIDRGEPALRIEHTGPATVVQIDAIIPDEPIEAEATELADAEEAAETTEAAEGTDTNGEGGRRRRRRRRRRGRGGEGREGQLHGAASDDAEESDEDAGEDEDEEEAVAPAASTASDEEAPEDRAPEHRRDRNRRHGRRDRHREERGAREERGPREPRPDRSAEPRREWSDEALPAQAASALPNGEAPAEVVAIAAPPAPEPEPAPQVEPAAPEPEPVAIVLTPPDPDRPKRAGWWSKAKSAITGS
jgi:ribonuclease E